MLQPPITAVTVSDPIAVVSAVVVLGCLLIALRSLDAVGKIEAKLAPAQNAEELRRLAAEVRDLLELADRLNGTKAAVFGVLGVFIGLVGGLSADWVAHGTWFDGETVRALGVVFGLLLVTGAAFYAVARWRPFGAVVRGRRGGGE
jgi:hypothetical protein